MLPLRDLLPTLRFPTVTLLLILVNVAVYLAGFGTQHGGRTQNAETWVYEYGAIPCEVTKQCDNQPAHVHDMGTSASSALPKDSDPVVSEHVHDVNPFLTLLTSAFVHGGFLHIAGNMLFLWVFGNNIEDALGRIPFLLWYLLAAVVSGLGQVFADTSSHVPAVGASGAIAATIGAYLILYPRTRIVTWVVPPIPVFLRLPAWLIAGFWGATQIWAASQGLLSPDIAGKESGDVAVMAHVVGFFFGMLTIRLLTRPTPNYAQLYGDHAPGDHRTVRPTSTPHARPAVPGPDAQAHRGPFLQ